MTPGVCSQLLPNGFVLPVPNATIQNRRAAVWMYPNRGGTRDIDPTELPVPLEMQFGVTLAPPGPYSREKPLLGMRAIRHNGLQLRVDGLVQGYGSTCRDCFSDPRDVCLALERLLSQAIRTPLTLLPRVAGQERTRVGMDAASPERRWLLAAGLLALAGCQSTDLSSARAQSPELPAPLSPRPWPRSPLLPAFAASVPR